MQPDRQTDRFLAQGAITPCAVWSRETRLRRMATSYNRDTEVFLIIPDTTKEHSRTRSDSQRRHTYDESKNIDIITSADNHTPPTETHFTENLPKFTGKRRATLGASYRYADRTRDFTDNSIASVKIGDKVLMDGWLYKTSRQKDSKTRTHGQHRRFRLTAHSLEYSHMFQKV